MVAPSEGFFPDFHDAIAELHLGQLLAPVKCFVGDRRDGGINPDANLILRNDSSFFTRVDEDLGISHTAAHHLGRHKNGVMVATLRTSDIEIGAPSRFHRVR
jgi:hypothetical protein